ncbi:MAG: NYN domain-containing protein [Gemmatimonadetes bacterium]|nr:NYN domain-containing protein [Gemmatimonadota bacterium]NNM05599.1 NYN domain-containing protein [Gemmatimonadota bacterium]
MSSPYSRAPHAKGAAGTQPEALNAALLIDFDNVTMGMRSDLSKELSNLLNSDIIKGKVTVQRAYADWRRYPQYIVPLSENSVDLIFAPAYGSSKKNATDIRMAIDAIELVFIRPEIGTFILLTGDSDFSSLVLKLKEYGKYVIGVGIQESSSDILVQNCDEYYSYTSLTGLRKTTDSDNKPVDPWLLVEQSVERMASRDDVMRSDRLKQVMIEIDPTFDEGNFGFSKFSRFLSEAGSRELVTLRKLENGQYEVLPSEGGQRPTRAPDKDDGRKRSGRDVSKSRLKESPASEARGRGKPKKEPRKGPKDGSRRESAPGRGTGGPGGDGKDDPLKGAYEVLNEALSALRAENEGVESVRDSDLKRKILELDSSFDEGELGFGKFSRFLRQAHDHEVIDLEKQDEGTYQVSPRAEKAPKGKRARGGQKATKEQEKPPTAKEAPKKDEASPGPEEALGAPTDKPSPDHSSRGGLGVRRGGSRGRKQEDGPPPLLDGQVVTRGGARAPDSDVSAMDVGGDPASAGPKATTPRISRSRRSRTRDQSPTPGPDQSRSSSEEVVDIGALGLPTDPPALIRYLTNSYKGVGSKTAERLVEEFGPGLFEVLQNEPERLGSVLRAGRLEQLLEGWKADLARRSGRTDPGDAVEENPPEKAASKPRRKTRRGTRTRGRSRASGADEAPA